MVTPAVPSRRQAGGDVYRELAVGVGVRALRRITTAMLTRLAAAVADHDALSAIEHC